MGGFFLWRIWCIAFMDFLVWLWRGCVALQVLLCLVYGGDIVCSCGDDYVKYLWLFGVLSS